MLHSMAVCGVSLHQGNTESRKTLEYTDCHMLQSMAVCGVSLHQGNTESRKTLEQKFIFQIVTFNPNGINERFSFN